MKTSRELNEYLSRVTESAGWDEPHGDGAAVAVPRKLYRVSEIATHLGLTRQTLHNYATIGLITEERRTDGGQRLFDESIFERLALIQRLKRTHRLHEIRRMLETDAAQAPAALSSSGARSMLERSQDIVSLSHLADDMRQDLDRSAPPLPREADAAQGPDVGAAALRGNSPLHFEKENPPDEQA
jgi:DNA-binding transcriptional MerR regulator